MFLSNNKIRSYSVAGFSDSAHIFVFTKNATKILIYLDIGKFLVFF